MSDNWKRTNSLFREGHAVGYTEGYEAGKLATENNNYAKGYSDAFNYLEKAMKEFFEYHGEQPIPARRPRVI